MRECAYPTVHCRKNIFDSGSFAGGNETEVLVGAGVRYRTQIKLDRLVREHFNLIGKGG